MAQKPRIFVGSSRESLDIAYAVQENLDHDAEVTVWTQGVMRVSRDTVANLQATLHTSDFGVFVLGPDDMVLSRNTESLAPRDNVIFELGMFVGYLGIERSLIVKPRIEGALSVKLPSDLAGVSLGEYNAQRSDGNLRAALGPATSAIRTEIRGFVSAAEPALLDAAHLSGLRMGSRAAAGIPNDRLCVFEVHAGRIRYRWFLEWPWSSWIDLELPDGIQAAQVAIGSHGSWFDLFVGSADGRFFHNWWSADEEWTGWTEWEPGVAGQITVASLGEHHNEVWVTRDGKTQHQWLSAGRWSGWHEFDSQE